MNMDPNPGLREWTERLDTRETALQFFGIKDCSTQLMVSDGTRHTYVRSCFQRRRVSYDETAAETVLLIESARPEEE